MSYSTGLKYKPMSHGIKELLSQVALVHMFEFQTDRYAYLLNNLSDAVSGKSGAACSSYNMRSFYNEENGLLEAIPTTTVKQDYPFKLFDAQSNVGLLINPEKVQFIYIAERDAFSTVLDDHRMVEIASWSGTQAINHANIGGANKLHGHKSIRAPFERTKEDSAQLIKVFNNEFMDKYKSIKDRGIPDSCFKFNEIGINLPKEAIEAVVIYSYGQSKAAMGYDKCHGEKNKINGVMLANLFINNVQQRCGVELPLLHYDLKASGKTNFNEVEIQNKKVINTLNNDPEIKALYEYCLGKERVQNMILGKTGFGTGGPS